MYYRTKELPDLTATDMEAADFANMCNESHIHAPDSFPTIERAIEEFVSLLHDTYEQAKAQYDKGQEVLSRYAIFHGQRTTVPFAIDSNGASVATDDKIDNAAAWFLVDAGHIATAPAYRFVRFYHRKEQPVR